MRPTKMPQGMRRLRFSRGRCRAVSTCTTAQHRVPAMRHFTPEEANAELEHVRPLVDEMVASRQEHAAALERQEELERKIRGNGGGIPPAELASATAEVDAVARRLAKVVDEITSHGAQVKDLDTGL